jgi:hypothetical protein
MEGCVAHVLLACDYGRLDRNQTKQDWQTIGPHTVARLEGAIAAAGPNDFFCVSAGRLQSDHALLWELQRAYLIKKGIQLNRILHPEPNAGTWGTKDELRYAQSRLVRPEVDCCAVQVWTEDYHRRRTRLYAWQIEFSVTVIGVDSSSFPPTREERLHEYCALISICAPRSFRKGLKKWNNRRRQRMYTAE